MDVAFGSRRLQRCYESEKAAAREWGPKVGRTYIRRVNVLMNVEELDDLFKLAALRLHPLTGAREGQWAVWLDERWRLIITKESETKVTVREVTQHYGD